MKEGHQNIVFQSSKSWNQKQTIKISVKTQNDRASQRIVVYGQMSIHKKTLETLSSYNLQNSELDDIQNQMLSPIVHCHSGQFSTL